jgi:hypothetical protein
MAAMADFSPLDRKYADENSRIVGGVQASSQQTRALFERFTARGPEEREVFALGLVAYLGQREASQAARVKTLSRQTAA